MRGATLDRIVPAAAKAIVSLAFGFAPIRLRKPPIQETG
jgi:hypothetical protein